MVWQNGNVRQNKHIVASPEDAAAALSWKWAERIRKLYRWTDARVRYWLGPVRGFAGNVIPLLRGWDWLTPTQQAQVAEFVPKTLAANAWRTEAGASWGARSKREKRPALCQHCRGAPGMVTTFADAPFATHKFDALLLDAGRFGWAAGPLTKGSNLCHGTGGNGYAFLKLYRRTSAPIWLDRARQFAMTAIAQYRGSQTVVGRVAIPFGPATSASQFTSGTGSQGSLISRRSTCFDPEYNASDLLWETA
jgi:hypothetical protein